MVTDAWIVTIGAPEKALGILEDFEVWLASNKAAPAPNLAECTAWYGYTWIMLQGWKLPISIPRADYARSLKFKNICYTRR